jgi:hypothetical protein
MVCTTKLLGVVKTKFPQGILLESLQDKIKQTADGILEYKARDGAALAAGPTAKSKP